MVKVQRHRKSTQRTGRRRNLTEAEKKSLAIIKTAEDLHAQLLKRNIMEFDPDEFIESALEEGYGDLEDDVKGELPDDDGYRDEEDDYEDEYRDFDEPFPEEPFEDESIKRSGSHRYTVKVSFIGDNPEIRFSEAPDYETGNLLINNALKERQLLIHKMALFIAGWQKEFFFEGKENCLKGLNQTDILKHLKAGGNKLSKEHISRMLDSLYFYIEGLGTLPAKYFFKRHDKSGLTEEEKKAYAKEFLETIDTATKMNQLEKAMALVKYLIEEKGISVRLSNNKDPHNKYKQWKKLISKVEKRREGDR
jgi:hypothetical protein